MRKIISICVVLAMVLSICPLSLTIVSAAEGTVSNLVYGGTGSGANLCSGLEDGADTNSTSWWTLQYAGINGTKFEGAWYIQLPGEDKNDATAIDEYLKFDIDAPATVYIGTNWNDIPRLAADGWTLETSNSGWNAAKTDGTDMGNYYNYQYSKSFDAGTVVIPSAGQALNYIFTTIIVFDDGNTGAVVTPTTAPTTSPSTGSELEISDIIFKGSAVTTAENEGDGMTFMYGDMDYSGMSFHHGWYMGIGDRPAALAGAKYMTTGADFYESNSGNYLEFTVNKPVIVVGMMESQATDSTNLINAGWKICSNTMNQSLYTTYAYKRADKTNTFIYMIYKEFPAGKVTIPYAGISYWAYGGGFAIVENDGTSAPPSPTTPPASGGGSFDFTPVVGEAQPVTPVIDDEGKTPVSEGEAEIMMVKDNRKGIVTMTNDDGYPAANKWVDEKYQEYGLTGTIMMICRNASPAVADFQEIFENGYTDIASHSTSHMYFYTDGTVYTDEQYETEIVDSYETLKGYFPDQDIIGFCPAGNTMTSEGLPYIKATYYAQRKGTRGINTLDPTEDEWYDLKIQAILDVTTAAQRRAWVDDAIKNNKWIIEMWHSIYEYTPNGYQSMTKADAEAHYQYLAEKQNDGELWVASFTEAIKYIRERQISTAAYKVYDDSIKVAAAYDENALPSDLFNYPLSVKVYIPFNWEKVLVSQGDSASMAVVKTDEGGSFVYADVIPNAAEAAVLTEFQSDASSDTKLSSLTYDGGKAVDGFAATDVGGLYTVVVPADATSVTVNAVANDANATVVMTPENGVLTFDENGEAVVRVVVTAEDKITKSNYKVTFRTYRTEITELVANEAAPTGGTVRVAGTAYNGMEQYTDRATMTFAHLGSALQGATVIRTSVDDHRADPAGQWTSGVWLASGSDVEYFNFTANEAGTCIVVAERAMQNFIDKGWTVVANGVYPTLPAAGSEYVGKNATAGYTDIRYVDDDWTPDAPFYFSRFQWDANVTPGDDQFDADGNAILTNIPYPSKYPYAYAIDFEANEVVSVPVPGVMGDPYTAFVVWGDNDIVEGGEVITPPDVSNKGVNISNVTFKGSAVSYGQNVGDGGSFMYGDMSNAVMSFQHGWPAAILAIPTALKDAKYFTTGSDFTGTNYDSYISFDVDEPVIVVGMYNADPALVSASNYAADGWTLATAYNNSEIYDMYKWLREGRSDYWNHVLYKEFPAGTVTLPSMKITSCWNYGGFAVIAKDGAVKPEPVVNLVSDLKTAGGPAKTEIIDVANATPVYSDRDNITIRPYTSKIFDGATLIQRAKADGGGEGAYTKDFYAGAYDGKNGNPYWMTFTVNEDATVYIADAHHAGWPNNDGTWKNDTNGLSLATTATPGNGEHLYYKHFKAGETVEIPNYGVVADWTATTTLWDPLVYAVVPDSLIPADDSVEATGLIYSGTDIEDFDPDVTTYNVVLPEGTTEVSLYISRGEYANAVYSEEKITEFPGSITATVYNSTGTVAGKTYTVNFTVGEEPDYVIGDVSGDGNVNALDRASIARYVSKYNGYETLPVIDAADVTNDGIVNALDRAAIARHISKWTGYETLPFIK